MSHLFYPFEHKFSASFFGLNASRNALGFRTNRVSQIDAMEERDLIKGEFNNFGFEIRFLNNYKLLIKKLYGLLVVNFIIQAIHLNRVQDLTEKMLTSI